MSIRLVALVAVIVAFAALTAMAVIDVGLVGIFRPLVTTWGGAQVLADLVIAATLGCLWMAQDARGRGIRAWPFILTTMAIGSFGILFYLALRETRTHGSPNVLSR